VHYCLAEYEQAIELAQGNLAALPANRIYDKFGRNLPASVSIRTWVEFPLSPDEGQPLPRRGRLSQRA
jgi:hypothetical protein